MCVCNFALVCTFNNKYMHANGRVDYVCICVHMLENGNYQYFMYIFKLKIVILIIILSQR